MVEQIRGLTAFQDNSSLSYSRYSTLVMYCEKLLFSNSNPTTNFNDQQQSVPNLFRAALAQQNHTLHSFKSVAECIAELIRLANNTNDTSIRTYRQNYDLQEHSRSLIIFVILITFVSLMSIIGNLCLAKVLYSKRYRLTQTDRIVLCLALSELCLVLIDTPTEVYRFLSYSFRQEWLCRFHTFFEALFSSCIIFYHLLGAFDRFVYIHGHTSSTSSTWSRWCRRISTKSGSIILLILPIICSLPIAICNSLHANIIHSMATKRTCMVQYTHGISISLLISFYILPLLFSFFLYGKLIYFIRTRHNQHYLTKTAYILPMKRNNTFEFQSKRRSNKENLTPHEQLFLQPKISFHRRLTMMNTETIGSTTTTTMGAIQSAPINTHLNTSSTSSQSSRSSTATSSASITSPIVLYKINSQANANANRTVLLLVLLLSFYVFCWAPYNIYTWHRAYQLTKSSLSNNSISSIDNNNNNQTRSSFSDDINDLRRIIFLNYSLYLLSMISMCFSFIFYFSLNKQARHEFSRFIGCMCPWIINIRKERRREKFSKHEVERPRQQLQYRTRYPNQYIYKNERLKVSSPSLVNDRNNYMKRTNYYQNGSSKRTVVNYGCQVQCCA